MIRLKKVEVNFNILLGVGDLTHKALEFADKMRSKNPKVPMIVVTPNPKDLIQEGATSSFVNINLTSVDTLKLSILNLKLDLFPRIFCLKFDISDIKSISSIINIASQNLLDVELFFDKKDRTISEIISRYTFLMKKANLNFYLNEHFKDLETDGSWRFSPGLNVIRR